MEINAVRDSSTLVASWRDLLVTETAEVERAGVNAAVVALRLTQKHGTGHFEDLDRVSGLVRRRLRSTDRLGATSQNSFAVLLSPANELTETVETVRRYNALLVDHRIPAFTAFAFRRPSESLIDTWARSEAELDRVLYRSVHGKGISL